MPSKFQICGGTLWSLINCGRKSITEMYVNCTFINFFLLIMFIFHYHRWIYFCHQVPSDFMWNRMSQVLQAQKLITLNATGVNEEDHVVYEKASCLINQSLKVIISKFRKWTIFYPNPGLFIFRLSIKTGSQGNVSKRNFSLERSLLISRVSHLVIHT